MRRGVVGVGGNQAMIDSGSVRSVASKASAASSRRPKWKSASASRKRAGAEAGLSSRARRAAFTHSLIAPRR